MQSNFHLSSELRLEFKKLRPQTLSLYWMNRFRKLFIASLLLIVATQFASAELLPPGHRPVPLGVHALVGGKIFIKPGEVLDNGTILIRDGLIEKVGRDLTPPPDARVWDMKGLTIYAGFIDPYLTLSSTGSPGGGSGAGERMQNSESRIQNLEKNSLTAGGVKFFGVPGGERDPGNPGPGSELSMITPERRAVKNFAPDPKALEKLREIGFTSANVVPEKGILRGTSAFVALSETDPNRAVIRADVFQHVVFEPEGRKSDEYPESLMGVIAAVRQSFFDAQHDVLEHENFSKHQGRQRLEFNPAREALAPAVRKEMRVVFEPKSALMVDRAARVAHELGLDFAIVSSGQEWRRPDLAKQTGASFIVPLNFPEAPKMPGDDDWIDVSLDQLRAWDWAPENAALLRQQKLEIALTSFGLEDKKVFRKNLKTAIDRGLSENDALAALTTVPAKLCGLESQLGTIEADKLANLTIVGGKGYFDPESKVRDVWIDGRRYRIESEEPKPENKKPAEEKSKEELAKTEKEKADKAEKEKKDAEKKEISKKRVARSPLEGRGAINVGMNPPAMIITNVTIWTCGPAGKIEHTNLFFAYGKIQDFKPPGRWGGGLLWIDGTGLHITPGLIDCHNHSMILHDVNEGTVPSSAMVRIGDVVNSETDNIYEQLAGGLTVANLLHGSANPIGGQNQVIKLRDGASPEDLKFADAPQGIKFALGENVKQSNWGEKYTTRFPQTRMGVRTFIQNRFIAAQQYLKEWDDYNRAQKTSGSPKAKKNGAQGTDAPYHSLPPRRDLELEAIGEILQGKRWIHCHSYRQDEILMLLRLMQDFHVQIGTFQHVLEGYKIADELAAGKVGASTFADWWAYKFEVYDAIPFNGSLMRERGVTVSFNSDSSDLARHLNLEAAKAVKFGGTSEEEALKFVTINPAKQLRIDQHVGSLEPGKDADFVIWSKSPLDSSTVCLETWIDGKKYFDRAQSVERTAALEKERQALIEKAKKLAKPDGGTEKENSAAKKKFFERSLEHEHDFEDRHCEDK